MLITKATALLNNGQQTLHLFRRSEFKSWWHLFS